MGEDPVPAFHANTWATYMMIEVIAAIPAQWPAVAMCPVAQKEIAKSRRFRSAAT